MINDQVTINNFQIRSIFQVEVTINLITNYLFTINLITVRELYN